MTITPQKVEVAAGEPPALLRIMLEEQLAAHTNRLTELTMYRRLPSHGGYDPHVLDILLSAAQQAIVETAQALQRMSEGTYGVCQDCRSLVPLGRLRVMPHARYCTRCHRHQCD
jgi:DnaK suppressor protein